MSKPLFIDGKKYISASRASKKFGYVSDYIGQLCRSKKITGKLLGKIWYVDTESLLAYKNKQVPKRFKNLEAKIIEKPIRQHTETCLNKKAFVYEPEMESRLPRLSKVSKFEKPLLSRLAINEALAVSLALILALVISLGLLEHTDRYLARSVFDKSQKVSSFVNQQVGASIQSSFEYSFDWVGGFWDSVTRGFRNLSDLALSKIFFATRGDEENSSVAGTDGIANFSTEPVERVVNTVLVESQPANFDNLKDELKSELTNYIRSQNSYESSPTGAPVAPSLVLEGLESFKTNKVVPVTYYVVTRQSDTDVSRTSSNLSRLTDGGNFTNAVITSSSFSGPSVFATDLSFDQALGTSATTTNLFATNATFTNLSGVALGLTDITFVNATGTNATTTSLFATTASTTNLFGSGLSTCDTATNALTWSAGLFGCNTVSSFSWTPETWGVSTSTTLGFLDGFLSTASSTIDSTLLVTGSSTLQNFTFVNATGTHSTSTSIYSSTLVADNSTTTNLFSTTASSTNLFSSLLNVGGNSLLVNQAGNVGVGAPNPGTKLTVNVVDTADTFQAASYTDSSFSSIYSSFTIGHSSAGIGFHTLSGSGVPANLTFTNAGTDTLILDENNNVGIGTTTPFAKLTVHANDGETNDTLFSISSSTASTYDSLFSVSNSGLTSLANLLLTSSTTLQNFTFTNATGTNATTTDFFSETASSTNLYASSLIVDGNTLVVDNSSHQVGIGIASPSALLHLNLASGNAEIQFDSAANSWKFRNNGTTGQFNIIDNSFSVAPFKIDNNSANNNLVITGGRVGIVDISPDFTLESVGSSGSGYFGLSDTSDGDILVVNSTGNLGIGTTSPYAKLSLEHLSASGTVIGADALTSFVGNLLDLKVASSTKFSVNQSGDLLLMGSTTLQNFTFVNATGTSATTTNFFTTIASTTNLFTSLFNVQGDKFVIGNGGFVGLSTTTPQTSFVISSPDGSAGLRFVRDDADVGAEDVIGSFEFESYDASNGANGVRARIAAVLTDAGGGTDVRFYNKQTSSVTERERLRITQGGTFGFSARNATAVETPGNAYHFIDTPQSFQDMTVLDGSTFIIEGKRSASDVAVQFQGLNVGPTMSLGIDASSGFTLYDITNTVARITVSNISGIVGNVGIASSSPWRTLSVNGTAAFTSLTNDGSGYYACVNTTTGELATSTTACGASSIKYKENVLDLDYGLEEVLALRPVSFDWKRSFIPNGTPQIGFIAEEVALVIPEIVGRNDAGEITNLDYPKLTAVIANALKELDSNLESLATTTVQSNPTSFADRFFLNLFARLKEWFADAGNGVDEFFARVLSTEVVYTRELCLEDVCVDKERLQSLLNLLEASPQGSLTSEGSTVTTSPAPNPAPPPGSTTSTSTDPEDLSEPDLKTDIEISEDNSLNSPEIVEESEVDNVEEGVIEVKAETLSEPPPDTPNE